MPDKTNTALANVRLIQAKEDLQGAEVALEANLLKGSANRSYYCIFHAMRAVLALEKFDSKKHSGIISAFRQRYIKTEIFPMNFSDIIKDAFEVRIDSDYLDFYVVSRDAVTAQINNARVFLTAVENYINTKSQE